MFQSSPNSLSKLANPPYQENEIDFGKDDVPYEKEECSMQEYEIMKVSLQLRSPVFPFSSPTAKIVFQDNLLLYNHARLMSQDNHSKDYLVSIMFSHYDSNNNGNLEATELNQVCLFVCFCTKCLSTEEEKISHS